MFDISIRSDLKRLEKKLDDLAYRQIPFATAQALTSLAKKTVDAEKKNLEKVLDAPTPFTVNSVGSKPARKADLEAVVYVKDIAASYLEPYEFGGKNRGVGSQDLFLRPADIDLNQFGNLPRNKIAQLKARSDVFIGPIKTKSGEVINGVWQRVADVAKVTNARSGKKHMTRRGLNTTGHLKLLIRFEDPHSIKQHLGWFMVAQRVVASNLDREMGRALAQAIASTK